MNASLLLAELALNDDTLELRLRGPLAKLTRAETLRAKSADLSAIFPIRSRSPLRFQGVGFRRPDGREYYFKTTATSEILNVFGSYGFPVSLEAQKAQKIWRATA